MTREQHHEHGVEGVLAGAGLGDLLDQLPAIIGVFCGPDLVVEYANPGLAAVAGGRPLLGRPVGEVFDEPENRRFVERLRETLRTGQPVREHEWGGVLSDPAGGGLIPAWFDFAYVPLRSPDGRVVGAIVHATDVSGLVETRRAAAESERRLRLLAEADVVGVVTADEERILEANDTFLELVGRTREEVRAGTLSWTTMTPPEWAAVSAAAVAQVMETGRAPAFEKEYLRPDGTRVPVLVTSVRLDDEPLRMLTFVIDQSARRAAEEEREHLLELERAARLEAETTIGRIARLQEATAALGGALTAAQVGEVTVTRAMQALGAEGGALGLLDEGDVLLVHDHGYHAADAASWRRFPVDGPGPLAEAVRTGTTVLAERREDWRRWPELTIRRFEGFAAVPLVTADRLLGAIALSFEQPRSLSPADHAFLHALADQAAQTLDRARLYEQRAYVARTLQAGLLPERLAEAPGLEVAVRYHSIADGGEVGGDFYDFFDVDGGWVAAVGDVAGKGSAAAVLTGLARHTLRAIATRRETPAAMLGFVNEALRRQSAEASFITLVCATVEPTPAGFGLRLAAGGHPYPLLVRAGGGEVEAVEVRGTLLGVEPDPELEEVDIELRPGDTLVLRTDGVEDARGAGGERFGETRLAAAIATAAGGDAEATAAALDTAVMDFETGRRRDDRAILVLRVSP
jgi:PAS domain S-box-containing protein